MNMFLVERVRSEEDFFLTAYFEYLAFIVVANKDKDARNIHPAWINRYNNFVDVPDNSWASSWVPKNRIDKLNVTFLGVYKENIDDDFKILLTDLKVN